MSGEVLPEDEYVRRTHRKYLYLLGFMVAIVALALFSFGTGDKLISFDIAMNVISDRLNGYLPDRKGDYWGWLKDRLVFEGTVPRAIGGIMVGAILGVSGAVMQLCVRNPLASPYTTGISSAALFGVTVYLVLGFSLVPFTEETSLIVNSFVFSLIPCALMVVLSMRMRTTPTLLVLIGIGVMYVFNAITMMLKYRAEPEILKQIQNWSVGSIAGIGWNGVWFLIGAFIFLFITMSFFSRKLDVLASGDRFAQSLGVNPLRTRIICIVIVSACTSVAVSFSGSIGFVGLVVPHVSRMFVGSKSSVLLPCSAVMGAILLLGSDVLARVLSLALPVGAVTAVIGAPLFLYFLFKMKSNGWGR